MKGGLAMSLHYKVDIVDLLKQSGYNTSRIRKEKLLAETTLQAFRTGKLVTLENIERVCRLCHVQPGDILIYEEESSESSAD